MKSNKLNFLSIACILFAVMIIGKFYLNSVNSVTADNGIKSSILQKKNVIPRIENQISVVDNDKDVIVNYPVSLSYKSKKDILALRKKYVENSIFVIPNYQPSEEVFGQIVSNKPWYSTDICKDINTRLAKVDGASEESRFINNPTMLVALEFPFLWNDTDDSEFCRSAVNQLIPTKISYTKSNNEISVWYEKLPFDAQHPFFYQFNGINANDLGYKYAYVDTIKSTFKPNFSNNSNLSTDVQQFQNFIHLGSSCQHEGGCNNGSPRQPSMEFNLNKGDGKGEIYIKLWRNKPSNPSAPADITERIIIEN